MQGSSHGHAVMQAAAEHPLWSYRALPQRDARFMAPLLANTKAIAQIWRIDAHKRIARVLRYVLRSLMNPLEISRWNSVAFGSPDLRIWLDHNPRLLLKPCRHYLNRNHDFPSRAALILDHYRLIKTLLSAKSIETLARGQSLCLAIFKGKADTSFEIRLERTDKLDREGELILSLRDAFKGKDIYRLAFTLGSFRGQTSLEIGCIQGPKGEKAQELVKQATKAFHRIRPRDLLLDAAYFLAKSWQLDSIHGVSNLCRIYRSASTYANYDAIWQEAGGLPSEYGCFCLAQERSHQPSSEAAKHLRAEYRRREELRALIEREMTLLLARYKP